MNDSALQRHDTSSSVGGRFATRPSFITASFDDDVRAPPTLMLREKMRPFVPYMDKPKWTDDTGPSSLRVSQLDKSWIDVATMGSWVRICDQHHGDLCRPKKLMDETRAGRPSWLIDVERLCLVPATPDMEYWALSYVWGTSQSALTLRDNVDALQKEKALGTMVPIPRTITHAIHLTRLLGGNYLWVDRFCIIQDDPVDVKQAQLDAMGDIYGGAYVTIVAASGDGADDGLKGIPGITPQRLLPGQFEPCHDAVVPVPTCADLAEDSVHYSDEEYRYGDSPTSPLYDEAWSANTWFTHRTNASRTVTSENDDFDWHRSSPPSRRMTPTALLPRPAEQTRRHSTRHDMLLEQAEDLVMSKWFGRGWTFQEYMLSRRKIIFQGETVNWECPCSAWHEAEDAAAINDQILPQGDPQFLLGRTAFDPTPWPDLYRFSRLVSMYNERSFTYPEDIIDAFAGVISLMSRNFVGGFVSGLPEMFFYASLLWQPYRPMDRRKAQRDADACLPSWSWVGWDGVLSSESWRTGYSYMRKNPDEYDDEDPSIWQKSSWRAESTAQWFFIDEQGRKRRINDSGHKYRDSCLDVSRDLPTGWTRHHCEITGEDFFQHECDSSQEFWFPIPLMDSTATASRHIRANHIWCRTRRAVLELGDTFVNRLTSKCVCVDLLDGNKKWVGALRPHSEAVLSNTHVELIELSAGSVLDRECDKTSVDEWFRPGCPRKGGRYDFYNVMSITWEGSVAYRQGIGRVMKGVWESCATEEIEVTLG